MEAGIVRANIARLILRDRRHASIRDTTDRLQRFFKPREVADAKC